ncbi:MAG: glycosyltransferase, partial [Bdellovibrionota bacterium]
PRWSRISKIEETKETRMPYHPEELLLSTICATVPRVDYALVLHQLRRGGSEKEGILHVNAYRELFPAHKIAVILTSPLDPDLEWQLSNDISVIELGKELTALQLDSGEKSYFLYRLLDQLDPRTIHVKGSDTGWNVLTTYGQQLAKKSKLLANLYCVDYLQDGTPISFGFAHLPRLAHTLTCLLADNQNVLDQMKTLVRVPTRKVAYPVELPPRKWSAPRKDEPFRVLWCSRLSFQKSINQLLLAASVFKDYEFHVYGEQSDELPYVEAFNQFPNVTYWGLFDHIEEVDLSRFRCFLYTSFWDGLPNILLEVGTYGMPIISPRVGGIGEILNERNSFLYDSGTELLRILNFWSDERAAEAGRRLRDDIAEAHTWEHFLDECRVIYGS